MNNMMKDWIYEHFTFATPLLKNMTFPYSRVTWDHCFPFPLPCFPKLTHVTFVVYYPNQHKRKVFPEGIQVSYMHCMTWYQINNELKRHNARLVALREIEDKFSLSPLSPKKKVKR